MEGGEADEAGSSRERRVLAKLVARDPVGSRGVFELGDGRRVTVDGHIDLDAADAPRIGEKALVVIDEGGRALRWEPYPGRDLRRRLD
jgi:hypothetical protein